MKVDTLVGCPLGVKDNSRRSFPVRRSILISRLALPTVVNP
ncbi:hypothetical protein ABH973_003772 [Bradyrhizobium ottawaense]